MSKLDPSWKMRRLVIFVTLIFCSLVICYIVILGNDTRINETIVTSLVALSGTVIMSYVFGSVWDDKGKIKGNYVDDES